MKFAKCVSGKLISKFLSVLLIAVVVTTCFGGMTLSVLAENGDTTTRSVSVNGLTDEDQDRLINDKDREAAYVQVLDYIHQIEAMYNMSLAAIERMDNTFYEFNVYVANTQMTLAQLNALVTSTKSNISATAGEMSAASSGESFIYMSNDTGITSAGAGQSCTVTLSLINLGNEPLTNLIITPDQSNDPEKWPFVVKTASDAQMIDYMPNASSMADSEGKKSVLNYSFTVSNTAKTGLYVIPFKVQYYRNGVKKEGTVNTYANITGLPENGSLIPATGNSSTPRLIVTGFTTEPEIVHAGDIFTVKISVQNTSSTMRVSNIQFDLKAAATGAVGSESYDAFLPTSGASSIYIAQMEPKSETVLTMEMAARSDLTQKPYVIDLSAKYEDLNNHEFSASTSISVPIYQEARVATSDADVLPSVVPTGGASNIMFDINNLGKTTLCNVQVSFDQLYVSGGSAFIGKITPGGTASVDVNVTATNPNFETGTVKCTITYEDESGNVSTIDKDIYLSISEETFDMGDMGDYGNYEDMGDDGNNSGINIGAIFGIISIAVIVAAIVIVIIVINVKKRKARKAELAAIENDSSDDSLM